MGKIKRRLGVLLCAACFALSGLGLTGLSHRTVFADDAASENALNEKLVVQYNMDDTDVGAGKKLAAYKWDTASQALVRNEAADATIYKDANGDAGVSAGSGTITAVEGLEGSGALSFTGRAHARANFNLPSGSTGMTITMLVKNINTYWSSLIEFWNDSHTDGGRLGKGTMQGNGGRSKENDAWSSNCSAHTSATMAPGGGWDSFVIKHNNTNNDNGGSAVDPMKEGLWYQVTYVITSSEVKAYRDGVLKQTFDKGNSSSIASSILRAVTGGQGKLGIRLSLDSNDGDILDDLRIYSGAFSEEEVKASLHPFIAAAPEYYDVEGLGYPTELLLDGATSVSGESQKTGTTSHGVTYTYTPLTLTAEETTPANDEKGVEVTFTQGSATRVAKVKFRRTLKLEAESLGYKIGEGDNVNIPVPAHPGIDVIVQVPEGTDLTQIKAGTNTVKKLTGDSNDGHYSVEFHYSATAHVATVCCSYTGYEIFATVYTIKFVEQSAAVEEPPKDPLPPEEQKEGCNGALSASAIPVAALALGIGLWFVFKKRNKQA